MDFGVKREYFNKRLFTVAKIKKVKLTYYHRSPASSSLLFNFSAPEDCNRKKSG